MVSKKSKVLLSCSTPEHGRESPSRDSDSLCDSEAGSPVPFLCTQDGAEGENNVVWNFYTPKSGRAANSHLRNSTPLSRKSKRALRSKLIDKPQPKRRNLRNTQKNTQLFQDLIELNQNLHELIPKKLQNCAEKHSGSEDDIFGVSPECSPKGTRRLSTNCLRKNVLSSNFNKPEHEIALDSDDSINECLIKVSQMAEDVICDNKHPLPQNACNKFQNKPNIKQNCTTKFKINHDSMDSILGNIKLESPKMHKVKSCNLYLKDDSFDSMFGNINDSVFEQLTQMPVKMEPSSKKTDEKVRESTEGGSPMSKSFGRHNSMPESPSITDKNIPSTSGMVFGRYNTMPYEKQAGNTTGSGDSPIRCTPDEIKRKRQLARQKLLAKRLLPFTSSQYNTAQKNILNTQTNVQRDIINTQTEATISPRVKNAKFQPKVPRSAVISSQISSQHKMDVKIGTSTDLKVLLEQKRQEALMKLRRRQHQNKIV